MVKTSSRPKKKIIFKIEIEPGSEFQDELINTLDTTLLAYKAHYEHSHQKNKVTIDKIIEDNDGKREDYTFAYKLMQLERLSEKSNNE